MRLYADAESKNCMTDILICANAVVFSIFHLLPVAGKIFMEKWIGLSRAGILCGAL